MVTAIEPQNGERTRRFAFHCSFIIKFFAPLSYLGFTIQVQGREKNKVDKDPKTCIIMLATKLTKDTGEGQSPPRTNILAQMSEKVYW